MRKWLSSVTGMVSAPGYLPARRVGAPRDVDIMPITRPPGHIPGGRKAPGFEVHFALSAEKTRRRRHVGKMIELSAGDGHKLSAYRAEPKGKPRGGLIVVQEIFGVNSHIKSVADGYAADGYLAIAPAFFDRVERGLDIGYTPPDIERGRAFIPKMQWDTVIKDAGAALANVKSAGKTGIVGYCWGGTVSWMGASRLAGLAAAVTYYGGG